MRKSILILVLFGILLMGLTGCKSDNENESNEKIKNSNNLVSSQEKVNEQEENNINNDIDNDRDNLQPQNLTVENFKKVMNKYGFPVESYTNSYIAYNTEYEIYFTLKVYDDEKTAKRLLNKNKTVYDNDLKEVLVDEEGEHWAKFEKEIVPYSSVWTLIKYRENNIVLDVEIKYEESVDYAREILSDLGY